MDRGLAKDLTKVLASRGRMGDTQVAHVGKGEMLIPRRVLDENPTLYTALAKSFSKSGLDPIEFFAGMNTAKVNPETGAEEFYDSEGGGYADFGGGQAAGDLSGSAAADAGLSDGSGANDYGAQSDYADGSRNSADGRPGSSSEARGGPAGGPLGDRGGEASGSGNPDDGGSEKTSGFTVTGNDIGRALGGLAGSLLGPAGSAFGSFFGGKIADAFGIGGPAFSVGGNTLTGGGTTFESADDPGSPADGFGGGGPNADTQVPQQYAPKSQAFSRPGELAAPDFLGLNPAMTDLQRRSAIATFGSQGEDSSYRDPRVKDYYYNLIQRALVNDQGGLNDYSSTVLPVEERYLRQTLGLNYEPQSQSLLNAIAGA